jgi:hypothetical protein
MNPLAPRSGSSAGPARYEIRIAGAIPSGLARELEGLRLSVDPAETVLYGRLPDQSALFGLLLHIHDLGLELLQVRRLSDIKANQKG